MHPTSTSMASHGTSRYPPRGRGFSARRARARSLRSTPNSECAIRVESDMFLPFGWHVWDSDWTAHARENAHARVGHRSGWTAPPVCSNIEKFVKRMSAERACPRMCTHATDLARPASLPVLARVRFGGSMSSNNTKYRVSPRNVRTSTVKKSAAGIASQWTRRNAFHDIALRRSGAGARPASRQHALHRARPSA
jgi:hypothetical protein